jgi:negative regulator of flagellin synthesis FlgM
MKINGKLETGSIDTLVKPKSGEKTSSTSSVDSTSTEEGAVAKLSGQVGKLNAPDAPFDAQKVAQIQQAIREGKFEINPEAIASKVIESARELLNQQ